MIHTITLAQAADVLAPLFDLRLVLACSPLLLLAMLWVEADAWHRVWRVEQAAKGLAPLKVRCDRCGERMFARGIEIEGSLLIATYRCILCDYTTELWRTLP